MIFLIKGRESVALTTKFHYLSFTFNHLYFKVDITISHGDLQGFQNMPLLDNLNYLAINNVDNLIDLHIPSSNVPNLQYLWITGSQLDFQNVTFISDLSQMKWFDVSNKKAWARPDLTNLRSLMKFDATIDQPVANISICLPIENHAELGVKISSHLSNVFSISNLKGYSPLSVLYIIQLNCGNFIFLVSFSFFLIYIRKF